MESRSLDICLLGPLTVRRGGEVVALPRSRKVQVLLAYLVINDTPQPRSRLCDLLWDVPNDPRGELRWCLSKLRGVLDDPDHHRVVTGDDRVTLDLTGCRIDVRDVEREVAAIDRASPEVLAALCDRFAGDLLDGVDLDGGPEITGWLAAQRNRFRSLHVAALHALASAAPDAEPIMARLDTWLRVAPFDHRAHQIMLARLVAAGRLPDAEDHLAGAIRGFEREGLDWQPLRDAWQAVRAAAGPPAAGVVAPAPAVVVPVRIEGGVALAPVQRGRRSHRASVAVLPFVDRGDAAPGSRRLADGLTEDIIMQLAKLRMLFVIARGSVFALRDRGVDAREAGRLLDVDYVASGWVECSADQVVVSVELIDSGDGCIVWTDRLDAPVDPAMTGVGTIVDRVVAALAEEIENAECQRAVLKPPGSLDAWEAYHRGLWHMYKFTGSDNRQAEHLFRAALELDPTFARAHAGLSFTHFQNAFLDLAPDPATEIDHAFTSAAHSLAADDQDPAAHWAMGRALWLRGAHHESLVELERSIELSPNFALGHYTLGFVHSQRGDPVLAIDATNYSRQLSPFDPLQFAMLASRALAHVRLDQLDEAAAWSVRATARPNAHAHILAIAAECLSLVERRTEAAGFVRRIRERRPGYSVEDLLRAFRFDADTERRLRRGASTIDFDH